MDRNESEYDSVASFCAGEGCPCSVNTRNFLRGGVAIKGFMKLSCDKLIDYKASTCYSK